MKSTRTLTAILGGSALLLVSVAFLVRAWLPHVMSTLGETTHAIAYACAVAWADLTRTQITITIITAVFIVGMAVWMAYVSIHMFRQQRAHVGSVQPTPSTVRNLASAAGLRTVRVIVIHNERPFAMTTGLVQPMVTISTGALAALSAQELHAVFEHEAHHVAQREPLRRLALSLALNWLPFRALRQHLQSAYIAESEIEADEHVTDQRTLGFALVRLVRPPVASAGFSPLDARVERLVNPHFRSASRSAVCFSIVAILVTIATVSLTPRAVQAAYGRHSVPKIEAHLTMCQAEHDRMLQSAQQTCGLLSTPRSCK